MDLEGEGGLEGERGKFRDSCLQWGLKIRADYFMNWLLGKRLLLWLKSGNPHIMPTVADPHPLMKFFGDRHPFSKTVGSFIFLL